MGILSEIVEGIINGIYKNRKKKKDLFGWEELTQLNVPSWVERASHKFHNRHPVKNHDKRKDFIGKHYVYRVIYRKVANGRVEEIFFRKPKNS
ncbi:hypothetical protein GW932_04125 [archaeon]|nr:hypothetical protein [archaeon]